jgi:hypothetical protein
MITQAAITTYTMSNRYVDMEEVDTAIGELIGQIYDVIKDAEEHVKDLWEERKDPWIPLPLPWPDPTRERERVEECDPEDPEDEECRENNHQHTVAVLGAGRVSLGRTGSNNTDGYANALVPVSQLMAVYRRFRGSRIFAVDMDAGGFADFVLNGANHSNYRRYQHSVSSVSRNYPELDVQVEAGAAGIIELPITWSNFTSSMREFQQCIDVIIVFYPQNMAAGTAAETSDALCDGGKFYALSEDPRTISIMQETLGFRGYNTQIRQDTSRSLHQNNPIGISGFVSLLSLPDEIYPEGRYATDIYATKP